MDKTKKKIGRLALRSEDGNWNAYFALADTMEDSILLGSIKLRFVQNPHRKALFMRLMREAVGDILEEITGKRPMWPEPLGHAAPEHERPQRNDSQ